MGTILNLFNKTGNQSAATLWTINATTTGLDLISYRYQSEVHNYQCQINRHNPQPVYQNRKPSCDLSTALPLGAILSAIDINRKLATINVYNPQPVYENRERLLTHSKQYKVSISTKVYFFSLDYELGP